MRKIKGPLLVTALFLLSGAVRFADPCDLLEDATSEELVSYLNRIIPDQRNGECIIFAVNKLGKQRYEPSIPVLTKLLDFRRPPNAREKEGLYLHIQGIDEIYPSAAALEEIGDRALPAILGVIKGESSSRTARENAVFVWMEIHKHESPKGVALLKREFDEANTTAGRLNLEQAMSRAVALCNPPDEAECKVAAKTGHAN